MENKTVGRPENMQGQVLIHGLLRVKVLLLLWPKSEGRWHYRTFHGTDGPNAWTSSLCMLNCSDFFIKAYLKEKAKPSWKLSQLTPSLISILVVRPKKIFFIGIKLFCFWPLARQSGPRNSFVKEWSSAIPQIWDIFSLDESRHV